MFKRKSMGFVLHAAEANGAIAFKPRTDAQELLGVGQLARASFHIPPTVSRQIGTAAFEDTAYQRVDNRRRPGSC